jgi:CDGSH-type Zn-finger protein
MVLPHEQHHRPEVDIRLICRGGNFDVGIEARELPHCDGTHSEVSDRLLPLIGREFATVRAQLVIERRRSVSLLGELHEADQGVAVLAVFELIRLRSR